MNHVLAMTKRNMFIFLRDRTAVFFSFLSTIILVALYFLFIAKMYTQGMEQDAAGMFSASAQNFLVYLQMMAGVLILNSMSLTMGAFSKIAWDFENNRTDNFLLTPLRKTELLVSYLACGFIVSFLLNILTWILSVVIIGTLTGYFVAVPTIIIGTLILLAASAISACIMLLITALVRSSAAISVFGGIAGTFFGFLCGIYIPYSSLGTATVKIGSFLPFTHLTVWMKQCVLADAFDKLSITGDLKDIMLGDYFSAKNVGLCGLNIELPVMLALCGVFALVCLFAAWIVLRKRVSD